MLHFRGNQCLKNFTSNATITRNDFVTELVVTLAASKIAQPNSKLQGFQRRYPLRSTFSGCDEKCRMCFLATVQWRHHLEDTPSSISVRSVACLGTKLRVWISSISVKTSGGHNHDKVWFLYVSVLESLIRVSSEECGRRRHDLRTQESTSQLCRALFRLLSSLFCLYSEDKQRAEASTTSRSRRTCSSEVM